MKDGQMIEQGTHEELLRLDGLYASMWYQQSLGEGFSGRLSDAGEDGGGVESAKELEVVSAVKTRE